MTCSQVFEDTFGSVIDHVDEGYIELRWYDSTSEMTFPEYQAWLLNFVDLVDKSSEKLVLVDATSFRLYGIDTTGPWREEKITPRYNQHGVVKLAYHLPQRSAPIGKHPEVEGTAQFPTGYFATRNEATEWLIT